MAIKKLYNYPSALANDLSRWWRLDYSSARCNPPLMPPKPCSCFPEKWKREKSEKGIREFRKIALCARLYDRGEENIFKNSFEERRSLSFFKAYWIRISGYNYFPNYLDIYIIQLSTIPSFPSCEKQNIFVSCCLYKYLLIFRRNHISSPFRLLPVLFKIKEEDQQNQRNLEKEL